MLRLTSERFRRLTRTSHADITRSLLEPCTGDELEAMCRLLAVAHSGTKAQRMERILAACAVRAEMESWGEYDSPATAHALADEIIPRYRRKELVALAKQAGAYAGLDKRGLVIGLLQWRAEARRTGSAWWQNLRARSVRQLSLPI